MPNRTEEGNSSVRSGLSGFYKTDTSGFRHFPESHGTVKGNGFRIVICYKFNLAYHTVSRQDFLKKCGTDSFSLILRKNQNILYENNGVAISHSSNDTDQSFSFIRSQRQQRIFKSFAQYFGRSGIGCPPDACVKVQNVRFSVYFICSDFHNCECSFLRIYFYKFCNPNGLKIPHPADYCDIKFRLFPVYNVNHPKKET